VDAKRCQQSSVQVSIQLNGVQPTATPNHGAGKRPLAGSDLDDMIRSRGRHSMSNGVNHTLVAQEILTKSFAGLVFHYVTGGRTVS
jgi:hypothetical protein